MEKPMFTNGKLLNLSSVNIKAMVRAFSIVITLTLIQNFGKAQVDCNTILGCTNGVQISLDDDCNLTVTPYMMMPAYTYHADSFDIAVELPNGTHMPQFTSGFDTRNRPIKRVAINRSHIGMNIKVSVSLRGCGNSCWGYAKIEDKLPPVITTCPCEQRITSFAGTLLQANPSYLACSGPTSTRYSVHNFAVSSTGMVDINLPNPNVRFSLYYTSFSPGSPCTNNIVSYVSNYSGILNAGIQYILVISHIGIPPIIGEDYEVFIDSRVGHIQSSTTSTVCEYSCTAANDILAQTDTSATNRPLFTDGCSGAFWVPSTFHNGTINFSGTNIILSGGNIVPPVSGYVVGAQICYTAPTTQNITFDWAATQLPNTITDSVYYVINNGTRVVLSTSLLSGTISNVGVAAGQVLCFKVNTDNIGPDNTLTLSNIKVDPGYPPLKYTKRDTVITLACAGRHGKIIRRQWTATDPSGNVSLTKFQYFYFKRGTIDSITCPSNYTLNCNDNFIKLPSGAPAPTPDHSPGGINCDNIQVYYDDILFDLCGAGIKVLRNWTIIDWCSGRDTICPQEIKVIDNVVPAYTCPILPNIKTNEYDCFANWKVSPPSPTDCSSMTWDVFISKDSISFFKTDGVTTVDGTSPDYANTISFFNFPFIIKNLPIGKTWIKYIVKDTCNNIKECITSIIVEDGTPPTAICEDETIVSIDDTGWGVLKATSLDNHSIDNCPGALRFEVKRKFKFCPGYSQDTTFRSEVKFCCQDVTSPESYHKVVLRVYDAAGNYNECETTVKVQNKRPAILHCPSDRSLICGDPRIDPWVSGILPFDTAFFGTPTLSGVCAQNQIASRIKSKNINPKCNSGTVVREWYLVSQPHIFCEQTLTITSPPFYDASVTFPPDITLSTCDIHKATPDYLNSKPTVDKPGCRDVGIAFVDQVFKDIPGVCLKIIRTWRVIDWCNYSQTPYVAERSQKIILTGSGPITCTGCQNRTITTTAGKCDTLVTLSANPDDECTDEEEWKYSWVLDLYKDGIIDDVGNTSSTSQNLPVGTHRYDVTVTNLCGIQKSFGYDINIFANKAPTPVCFGEIIWVMDPTKSTEVWASDFIQSASTNICGRATDLEYYVFKKNDSNIIFTSNKRSIVLTCSDIPNGQVARIPLKVYVRDKNTGLFDYCDVTLILQDSPLTNACLDVPALLPVISGKVTTDRSEGIEDIEVSLKNMNSASEIKSITQKGGEYRLEGVDVFDPKIVGAYNNNGVLNGVSTLDLVLIQRHILGIQNIESPYLLLAADVNNSGSITASDLVSLRKLVLGVTDEFDHNTSWRFVPSSYVFSDPANPFDYPDKVNFDSLYEDKNNVNFTAIKVGDINRSVVVNAKSTENRSGNLLFTVDHFMFTPGQSVKYEVRAGEALDIFGAQFGLAFEADKLSFVGVTPGAFDIKSYHYNPFQVRNGKLNMSYDVAQGKQISPDDVLFTIEFKAISNGNTKDIKLDPAHIKPEVYETDGSVRNLFLQNRDKKGNNMLFNLYQNEPNPFKESTAITFDLTKSEDVTLRIMDLTGKVILTQSGKFDKGFNVISINNAQIGNAGIYYYQIEAGEFTATKKMILIK